VPASADSTVSAPASLGPARRPWRRSDLQELMWHAAGLIREEGALARAESELASWAANTTEAPSRHDETVAGYEELVTSHEDRNLLLVARLLTHAARTRPTSLGAHFRADAAAPPLPEHAGAGTSAAAPASSASTAPGELSTGDLSPTGASPAAGAGACASAGVDMTLEFH